LAPTGDMGMSQPCSQSDGECHEKNAGADHDASSAVREPGCRLVLTLRDDNETDPVRNMRWQWKDRDSGFGTRDSGSTNAVVSRIRVPAIPDSRPHAAICCYADPT
jgi:hypothetical protein